MASLPRRGVAAPLLPLSAIVALTPTQLVANFPAILDTLQSHHLLQPPPATSTASSTSVHARFLTKCIGLISQGQRTSCPPEQWCGLLLLSTLVRQSSPTVLTPHYPVITATLSELQKQAGHAGDVLDLPLLECMAAVLCSAAEAGGEVRRDMMTTHLNKTVGSIIDRLTALLPPASTPPPATASTRTSLRRLLAALDELLSVYGASLRSFSSRLQPLLTSLLLYCDDSCLPPLLHSLTALLVSLTTAANTQQSNRAKQARMQQAAQDTTDEVAQQKLTASTTTPTSPYHTFAAGCVQHMTAAVDELSSAVSEQPLTGSGVRGGSEGLGWEAVVGDGVVRALEVVRRYERLCVVLAALVAPQLPTAMAVDLSLPLLPLLHVMCGALSVEPYTSSGSSMTGTALSPSAALLVLPSLYDSSLRLLDTLLQHCRHALLSFVYPLASLLVDVHRRCNTTPSLTHLLPAVYRTLTSLFRLPLSPSLLATLSGSFVSSLLSHVQQPFVWRRELTMHQVSQSMVSQLKPAAAHSRRSTSTSATSTASATSELAVEQQRVREEVAAAALLCLHGMLEAGSLLPLTARTTIDSTLLLLAMSLASSTSSALLPLPSTIRLPLYRCLLSSLVHPPAASPSAFTSPLLSYVLPILTRAAMSADGEESGVCRDGLLLCEWLTRERTGVSIGKRRKADRLFDRKDGEDDVDGHSHVLDGLDEWSGVTDAAGVRVAAVGGELSGGGKRRRTVEDDERDEERRRVNVPIALSGVTQLGGGRGGVIEQKDSMQQMEEVEERKQGAEGQSSAEQQGGVQVEQKQPTSSSSVEHSDDEEEEEGVPSEDERQQSEEEVEESEEKEAENDERMTGPSNKLPSGDVSVDEEFGAVLYVDDELDEG